MTASPGGDSRVIELDIAQKGRHAPASVRKAGRRVLATVTTGSRGSRSRSHLRDPSSAEEPQDGDGSADGGGIVPFVVELRE